MHAVPEQHSTILHYTEAHCIREEDAWVYRWGYKFIYVYTFIVVVMQCCLLLSQ